MERSHGLTPLDLYGTILFHSGRFRRLRAYHHLRAKECIAEIAPATSSEWFWRYLPSHTILGDPAVRDAAIHAIQACIPQATLLPTGVDCIVTSQLPDSCPLFVHAWERNCTPDTFVYDVDITDANGNVVEHWQGLCLRRIRDVDTTSFAAPLLGPYLERRIAELIPEWSAAVVVEPENHSRRDQTGTRRPDGKPDVTRDGWHVSASHCGGLRVSVTGPIQVSCDAEEVTARPTELWRSLLGADGFALAELIAGHRAGNLDLAATHVWTARECLTKVGAPPGSPLTLERCSANGAVLLASGSRRIATLEVSPEPLRIFTFLTCEATNSGTL
jgi:enediyne polyketide synthase